MTLTNQLIVPDPDARGDLIYCLQLGMCHGPNGAIYRSFLTRSLLNDHEATEKPREYICALPLLHRTTGHMTPFLMVRSACQPTKASRHGCYDC